jgi:ABC-type multidrug transport system fused ATPase/permease subunit
LENIAYGQPNASGQEVMVDARRADRDVLIRALPSRLGHADRRTLHHAIGRAANASDLTIFEKMRHL